MNSCKTLLSLLLSSCILSLTMACTPITGGGAATAPIVYGATATAPQSAQKAAEKKEEAGLALWQDTDTKKKILEYLAKVTKDEKSEDFIPAPYRIAVFDNDGTLWGEQPPVWALFTEWRIRVLSEYEPQMRTTRPYQTLLSQGAAWLDNAPHDDMMELIAAASTGTSQNEFRAIAAEFFATKHPQLQGSYQRNVYPPMRELLALFEKHGFKNFIVTGGDVELVRAVSQAYYNIPPEQVIGSTWRVKPLVGQKDVTLYRENVVEIFTNKNLKPVMIDRHIGKIPVVAVGNDGGSGDIAMLKYSQTSNYPSLQLMVKHDDSVRERIYSDKDGQSLNTAEANGWTVVSIAKDWKEVFGKE